MEKSQKITIEIDYETFIASIEKWDGEKPTFHECVATGLFLAAAMEETDRFLLGVVEDSKSERVMVLNWALGGSGGSKETSLVVVASVRARLIECNVEVHKRIRAAIDELLRNAGPGPDGFE